MRLPSRENLFLYLGLSLLLNILFVVIYGGSNWLNSNRDAHYSLYASWELEIPLLPAMIFPYMSLSLLFLLPLFMLNRDQLILLAKRMASAIVIAGIIFNLVPTELGFERHLETGAVGPIFELIYWLDQPHNLFPSLHVALTSIVMIMLLPGASAWLRLTLQIWWVLLCLSVVLVHQHHLLDIIGGLVLAGLLWRLHSEAAG